MTNNYDVLSTFSRDALAVDLCTLKCQFIVVKFSLLISQYISIKRLAEFCTSS